MILVLSLAVKEENFRFEKEAKLTMWPAEVFEMFLKKLILLIFEEP